ncbi:MAG: amidohydrolase [Acidobacteria bacterium]|nr:amidohydrolase [Acidobacteriota bacterium]
MNIRLFALTAILASACASTPTALVDDREAVDLLISGGTVVTISGENIERGAVAVRRGEIVAVGPATEIEDRFRGAERIDATGSAILPGLVNAHTHAPMTLFRGIADDLALMDWLQNYIFPAEASAVDEEFVRWGTRLAAAEMILSGTTTYADMYYFEIAIAEETKRAGLRGVLGETLIDFPAPDNKTWEDAIAYMRRFAAAFENDPLITPAVAPHAPFTVSKDHLEEVRALATELGVPILIHLAETEDELRQVDEKYGVHPVDLLEQIGFLGDDVVGAHGVWLTPEQIDVLVRHRTGIVHNPESNMMLASGVAPVTTMLEKNLETGLGTDGPAGSNNNLDMIEEMASAARLQKVTSGDPRAISAEHVLRMATLGGAEVLGLDDRIGSIETGKRADLIVIDLSGPGIQPVYSVESAVVYAANGSDVTHTIVDGKVLMRDRKLLTLDLPEILAAAERYRESVLEIVGKD